MSIKTVQLHINGEMVSMEIWDAPGELASDDVATLKGHNFHAVIICFSIEAEANIPTMYDVRIVHARPTFYSCIPESKILILPSSVEEPCRQLADLLPLLRARHEERYPPLLGALPPPAQLRPGRRTRQVRGGTHPSPILKKKAHTDRLNQAVSNARFFGAKYYECTATVHESVFGAVDQIATATMKGLDDWEAGRAKRAGKGVGAWCFQ